MSVPTRHFDRLYADSEDPWDYEDGLYEQHKYARTIELLPRSRYRAAFELGCSIGVLTNLLAARCDNILAADCSVRAISLAKQKRPAPNIDYCVMRAPHQLPTGRRFDLVVLSEVLYFFSERDLSAVAAYVGAAALPSSTIIMVNYLGPTGETVSGDEAADRFLALAAPWSRGLAGVREPQYRIDLLERV